VISHNGASDPRQGPAPKFRIRSATIGTCFPATPSLGHESRLRHTQRTGLVCTRHSLVAAQGAHGINLGGPARGDVGGHCRDQREEGRQRGEDWRFDSNDAEHGVGNGLG
jgi:hypothetical protein